MYDYSSKVLLAKFCIRISRSDVNRYSAIQLGNVLPSFSSARMITSADENVLPIAAPKYGRSLTWNFSSFSYRESSMIFTGQYLTASF